MAMKRVLAQRLARISTRFTHASAPLCAAQTATTEELPKSSSQAGVSGITVLPRENWTLPGAQRAYSSQSNAAYQARNYASNINEYNKVLGEISLRKQQYLMRDVYEDMQMDGVRPIRDTFHTLITGCMRGDRLQDVMYFFDEMKSMGLAPDIVLYNCVISSCGRANQIDRAFQVAEEMEKSGLQPKLRTFLALLNACGSAGRVEEAYGVVRRMAASGLTLNSPCYSALITAHQNSRPVTQETFEKIFELLEQSKGCEAGTTGVEGRGEFEEELANLVTGGGLQATRSYVSRRLNVYYSALRACGELGNTKAVEKIIEMMEQDGHQVDASCITELIKSYIAQNDLESVVTVLDRYMDAGTKPSLFLYITAIEGLLRKHTPFSLTAAKKFLQQMDERGYFLNTSTGSMFLIFASMESGGDFSTACAIWDMMLKRDLKPSLRAVNSFCEGLQRHEVPEDDIRLAAAKEIIQKAQQRNNWVHGTKKGSDQEQESAEDDSLHVNEEGGVPVEDHVESEPGQEEQENEHVATTT